MRRPPLSVLIAHDADLVVQGVQAILARHPDRLGVVGCHRDGAGSGNGARADVALIGTLGSTQVLTERIRAAVAARLAATVGAFTWGVSSTEAERLLAAGATGVLAMAAPSHQLVDDLERVGRGEQVLRGVVGAGGVTAPVGVGQRATRLSAREVELLTLLADGLNNAEIGEQLYLAQSTVKTYLKRLYRKLEVNTRTQAVIRAVEMGLIGHGQWAMARHGRVGSAGDDGPDPDREPDVGVTRVSRADAVRPG